MAEAQKLAVRPRTVLGKKVNGLRREGLLPGVIGDGHGDSTPVQTDGREFERGFRRWGKTTLLSLEGLPAGEVPALIRDVSRDPRTGRLLHIDFTRVSLTEKTRAEVPLQFVGESPAVKTLGAVLVHAMSRIVVEAFPQDMPHRIEVSLTGLEQIDDALHVRDLVVDIATIRIVSDPDDMVVKAVPMRVEEEKPVAQAAVEGEIPAEGVAAEGEVAEGETAGAKPGAAAPAAKGAAPAAKGGAPAAKGGAPAAKGAPAEGAKKEPAKKG